eukprot:152713-Chlamydomonas_euryale.AAC.1
MSAHDSLAQAAAGWLLSASGGSACPVPVTPRSGGGGNVGCTAAGSRTAGSSAGVAASTCIGAPPPAGDVPLPGPEGASAPSFSFGSADGSGAQTATAGSASGSFKFGLGLPPPPPQPPPPPPQQQQQQQHVLQPRAYIGAGTQGAAAAPPPKLPQFQFGVGSPPHVGAGGLPPGPAASPAASASSASASAPSRRAFTGGHIDVSLLPPPRTAPPSTRSTVDPSMLSPLASASSSASPLLFSGVGDGDGDAALPPPPPRASRLGLAPGSAGVQRSPSKSRPRGVLRRQLSAARRGAGAVGEEPSAGTPTGAALVSMVQVWICQGVGFCMGSGVGMVREAQCLRAQRGAGVDWLKCGVLRGVWGLAPKVHVVFQPRRARAWYRCIGWGGRFAWLRPQPLNYNLVLLCG